LLGRALACAGDVELDAAAEGTLLGATGFHALLSGNFVGCVDALRAETELLDRTGDRSGAALSRGKLAAGLLEIGAFTEAEHVAREALATADAHGYESAAALAHATLGRALARLGRLGEACAEAGRGVAAYAAQGAVRAEGAARGHFAAIRFARCELDEAEREAHRALDLLGTSSETIVALGVLSRILLARGDMEQALRHAETALGLIDDAGGVPDGDALVRLAYAEALRASGDETRANATLCRARERLLARVAEINEPGFRAALLEEVPEHRDTLELARRCPS
jgi:tetratricopeptide (TPR) repeat protein